MANALMMRYAASRGNQNEMRDGNRNEMREGGNRNEMRGGAGYNEMRGGEMRGNRNEMHGGEMRGGNRSEMYGAAEMNDMRGGNRSEMYGGDMRGGNRNEMRRQPNQYTRRNGMDDEWPEDNGGAEMRRRRDSRGRYAGYDDEREDNMRYDRQESRFMPPYGVPPQDGMYDGGNMGFGSMERSRSHYGEGQHGRKMVKAGGTFYMEPQDDMKSGGEKKLTREAAQKWVDGMEYYDDTGKKHQGGKWSMTEVKPFAGKMGVPIEGEEFYEFYAMMNAMYADYMAVARKYGVTSPEYYAAMAKAWIDDPDAKEGKTMLYYNCIVEKTD